MTGLDDRYRDKDGRIRAKNDNTQIGTLREIYGANFAVDRRKDMHLGTLLDESDVSSLSEYLRKFGR